MALSRCTFQSFIRQQGSVLILAMLGLMILTLLSFSYFEQGVWLQKIRHQFYQTQEIQQEIQQMITNIIAKPIDSDCIQSPVSYNWFDHWNSEIWHNEPHCELQTEKINVTYRIEPRSRSCGYFIKVIDRKLALTRNVPAILYRITMLVQDNTGINLIRDFILLELYIAGQDPAYPQCSNFQGELTSELQSRRQRIVSKA